MRPNNNKEMKPLKDCKVCGGTGIERERRPDYWGFRAYEDMPCGCLDREEKGEGDEGETD